MAPYADYKTVLSFCNDGQGQQRMYKTASSFYNNDFQHTLFHLQLFDKMEITGQH